LLHHRYEGSAAVINKSGIVLEPTSRLRTAVVSQQPLAYAAWSRTMKTIVASFLGLIALVTFAGGSPVRADALEAEPSALSIPPGAGTSAVESLEDGHCAFYSDGADNCIVNVQPEVNMQPEAVDQSSTAVSESDPSATESTPAIRFMDAIPVMVVQTVTIAASGVDAGDREGTSQPIPVPATEPVLDHDAKTTTGAIVEPTGQSADAIRVAIVQSATVVVPGQDASGGDEPAAAELRPPPTAPSSVLEAKNVPHDDPQ
jgi:hypothetical protein